mmetsp:Transcript_44220/g.70981  ORF Transcript_44220/g.70981 Transcript_44220/m.70981 type:complete len:218 (+) Transcript_44220:2358-3011(+)
MVSRVSLIASLSVLTTRPGKPMPTLPCHPKCLMMDVSAAATVESSESSKGIVMSSSMSSPVSVSTGAARRARASLLLRRISYTPRMLRRSDSEPLVSTAGCRDAVSSPDEDVACAAVRPPFLSLSSARLARRRSAAAAAASASSSTGGAFSLHSPSKSVQLPSPFSSMLIRPSAKNPSAAPPMFWRFLVTILYAISAALLSTGSLANLNSHPIPVIS